MCVLNLRAQRRFQASSTQACGECLEIPHGYGAHLRLVEAVKLSSFAPRMGMGRVSSHHAQCSGFVGWWVEGVGRVGDALLELLQ